MTLNPVERRLALLCGEWIDFRADTTKRLLVWQVPENAVRLVRCFFEVQKHDLEYSSRDLFIILQAPFDHSIQYSRELKEAMWGQYEASHDDLVAQNLSLDWSFDAENVPDSPAGMIDVLRSFASKYHKTIGHLVAVLLPDAVSDAESFSSWVSRALSAGLPERVRLVVLDSLEHPRFLSLTAERDARIAVQRPAVDGLSTAQETFAQEQTVGPAGVFRNLMMGVVSLVEKGSADQVRAKATDALNFARQRGWPDQEVLLRVLVGGALVKESRHQEAIAAYRAARTAAEQTVASNHPAGHKLVLQTWFGEAGASLAAGDVAEAARCYDEAAAVAERDQNAILAIEARRMAAFCCARVGDLAGAIDRGRMAMEIGERLEPEARPLTTLPLAAADLLRVIDPDRVQVLERVKGRLDARVAQARGRADQRAVDMESGQGPPEAHEIERDLESETQEAARDGEAALVAVIDGAAPPFRERFQHAREQLGAEWPLQSAVGLSSVADIAEGTAAS